MNHQETGSYVLEKGHRMFGVLVVPGLCYFLILCNLPEPQSPQLQKGRECYLLVRGGKESRSWSLSAGSQFLLGGAR